MQTLHPVIVNELGRAWERLGRYKFQVQQQGRGVRRSQLSSFGSQLVVVRMDLEVDQKSGALLAAVPLSMKPPDDAVAAPGNERAAQLRRQAILGRLQQSNLDLEVTVEGSTIRLADLLGLHAGDVLRLDAAVTQPVGVRVNGGMRFQGRFAAERNRRSLVLEDLPLSQSRKSGPSEPIAIDRPKDSAGGGAES